MSGPMISGESTLFEVTERYPATIQVLVDLGLPKMADPEKRRVQGKALTVAMLAQLQRRTIEEIVGRLQEAARQDLEQQDVTLREGAEEPTLLPAGDIRLSGLLPCPVRLPILEAVREQARRLEAEQGLHLGWSLAAASVGADQLNRQIARVEEEAQLPELFISAGFESFFDRQNLHRFKERGVFVDVAPPGQNACFGELPLRDPDGHFTLLGVVPAVFLINRPLLGDVPEPRCWEDLLHERLAQRLALPVKDFDLFNAILLHLHQRFGRAGVEALARNMMVSVHPSQTVGRFSGKQAVQPAVSVVPYFFSRMTMGSQSLVTVWPEDGAVLSPIFMLVKASARETTRHLTDSFTSRAMGEILAHKGLMPALHPQVDNRLPAGARFQWLGWPFFQEQDLAALLAELNVLFTTAAAPAPAITEESSLP